MSAVPHHSVSLLALVASAALAAGGCAGGDEPASSTSGASPGAVPAALIAETWPVRMSDDATRAPFEGDAGWTALFARDYGPALEAFSAAGGGEGVARMHIELAALHEQAALLATHATRQVYGADRQDVDPAAVGYLVGAAAGIQGDCAAAAEAFAAIPEPPASVAAALESWGPVVEAGCPSLTLDLGLVVPGAPGAVAAGSAPGPGDLPHYMLVEQTDEGRSVKAGDPTTLALLARWHRDAAVAAGAPEPAVDLLLAPWTVREGAGPDGGMELSDALLFGGFALTSADAAFLADARVDGVAAVEAYAAQSPLAAALQPAVVDGSISTQAVFDQSVAFGAQLREAMEARSGGVQGFTEPFAQIGRLAVVRAGMVVADGADQYRDAGILRLNTLELSSGPAADPVFLVAAAAWDVGNRNPLRAQEVMHRLAPSYPALSISRYPLDAMHIRLSRNAAPSVPVH